MSEPTIDEAADDVFVRILGGLEALTIYLGDRLGLYEALRGAPATPAELAARAGIDERYAREWLEQQAVAGLLAAQPDEHGMTRFALAEAYEQVLADSGSLAYLAPLARMLVAAARRAPDLIEAYRSGGGVTWAQFGADARDAQGDVNRPWFESQLAAALASVPEVQAVLSRPDARIADVGCGHGWSSIALARAYPQAVVDGFDLDAPSLVAARQHAAGVPNVAFHDLPGERITDARDAGYAAGFVFEALHDMPDPVGVLSVLHRTVADDGVVIVMDEAVADDFAPPGDEVERVMYTYSVLLCLPDSKATPGSVATGTVMRHSTLDGYTRQAGFAGASVLPIEGFGAFRFYLLERG